MKIFKNIFLQQNLEREYLEDRNKTNYGRDYNHQPIRDVENRKSIILNGSPRIHQKRSLINKRGTLIGDGHAQSILQSQNMNLSQNNLQSRKMNGLNIITNQNEFINQGDKAQRQNDKQGERLNSLFKTENWNDKLISLEEKNKNDFLFEFDTLKLFSNYFQEGNANLMIIKWAAQRKKYLKKFASGEAAAGRRNNKTVQSIKYKSSNILPPISPLGFGSSTINEKK